MTHSFPPRRPSDRGPQTLKGIARPAAAWRVLRRRDLDRRAEAMQGDDLVPFVNRTGEITLLLDRWRMAGSGHGQIVLLRSEEHTSELQSLMRNSYAVFCLQKKTIHRKPLSQ